jgi:myo-inositol-1(or 4)-monophosphatase
MSADERIGSGERQQLAADLVIRGGRIALEYFHRAHASKDRDGAVSETGAAIRERLAAEIAAAYPGDTVLGAEGSASEGRAPGLYSWGVGAVDGLSDFARGLPGFTISIGVLRDRMPFAGAVYDPVARWLFTAGAGRGAWLNDRPLHVVTAALSRTSLVAVGSPLEAGMPPLTEEWLRRYRLRRVGSTALHLCYVAMGAVDLVHDHRTSLREVAGAAAVVLEAGGVMTLADGRAVFPPGPAQLAGAPISVLAGNPMSHEEALTDVVPVLSGRVSI